MAENKFSATAEALFKGMNGFVNTKTVVGEPQQIGDAIIIPLVDISCGMAAGSFVGGKDNGAGGMNTKMSPSAVLILQNGVTKLVTVKNQDAVSKVLDMVPEVINHFSAESKIYPEAKSAAKKMVEKSE